jgi:hypothetical protein
MKRTAQRNAPAVMMRAAKGSVESGEPETIVAWSIAAGWRTTANPFPNNTPPLDGPGCRTVYRFGSMECDGYEGSERLFIFYDQNGTGLFWANFKGLWGYELNVLLADAASTMEFVRLYAPTFQHAEVLKQWANLDLNVLRPLEASFRNASKVMFDEKCGIFRKMLKRKKVLDTPSSF